MEITIGLADQFNIVQILENVFWEGYTNAVSLETNVVHGVYYKLSVHEGDLVFSLGGLVTVVFCCLVYGEGCGCEDKERSRLCWALTGLFKINEEVKEDNLFMFIYFRTKYLGIWRRY